MSAISCSTNKDEKDYAKVSSRSIELHDSTRKRTIPLEVYSNRNNAFNNGVVIISAGYGCSNTEYSYLAKMLAQNNFLVISTHHEQEFDSPLPGGDSLYAKRLPFWEEGVTNLKFIIQFVRTSFSEVPSQKVNLIGHSNGGDISALFAQQNSEEMASLITLDHRRVRLPRTKEYPIMSFRGSDFDADPHVLPDSNESEYNNIKIVAVKNAGHNFLRDNGRKEIKAQIAEEVKTLLLK